jgi:outer membrane protein
VGYIDMERLFQNLKEGKKIQEDVQKRRADYEKLVDEKQKTIDQAKSEKKSDEDMQKIVDKIKIELKPKQEEILKYEAEVQQKLMGKIKEMTKVVSKRYGVDVVLDKRVVYFGGLDLTDFIVDKLNK